MTSAVTWTRVQTSIHHVTAGKPYILSLLICRDKLIIVVLIELIEGKNLCKALISTHKEMPQTFIKWICWRLLRISLLHLPHHPLPRLLWWDVPSHLAHLWTQANCVCTRSFLIRASVDPYTQKGFQEANHGHSTPANSLFLTFCLCANANLRQIYPDYMLIWFWAPTSFSLIIDFWVLLWAWS